MSVRSLAVDIAFDADIGKMLAVDSAVDGIRDGAIGASDSVVELGGASETASSTMLQNFTKAGEGMQKVGKDMSKWLTVPLVGAGAAAFKFAVDQEAAFAQVTTLLDESTTDFTKYKSEIRSLSSEMGIAFEDVAESVYSSMSAGQDQNDAIEFTRKAIKLAGGGFTETANAVDVMTTALNAYGLESKEASSISDMLITTQNLGKTTVDALSTSMGAVIPIAQAQGVGFDQLSAGYAALTKNGLDTAVAGTGMKAMFSELGKAGSKVDKVLRKETGKSFSELSAAGKNTGDVLSILQEQADKSGLKLSDLFGSVQAGGAALTLAKDSGAEFQEMLVAMQGSAGATETAFGIMVDTTGDKMAVAWTTIKNTMTSVADIVLPIVADFAVKTSDFVSKFSDMSLPVKKAILIFGGIAAAIGPVLILTGKIMTSVAPVIGVFGKMSTAIKGAGGVIGLLTNPIGIAIVAIGLIVGAVVLAYNKVEWFRDAIDNAWAWIKDSTAVAFEWIKGIIETVMSSVTEFIQSVLTRITGFWNENGTAIMALVEWAFNDVKNYIVMVMGIIQGIFQVVWPIISGIVEVAWGLIQAIVGTALDIVFGLIGAVMSAIEGDWSGAWESIKGIATSIWENIEGFFRSINLFEIGANILQGLIDGIGSMANAVGDRVKGIADSISNGFKKSLQIFSPSRLFKQHGIDTMLGYTIGFEDEAENATAAAELAAEDIADPFGESDNLYQHTDRDEKPPQNANANQPIPQDVLFNPQIEININGNADGQDIRRELEQQFPELMAQFFAMLAAKRGGVPDVI